MKKIYLFLICACLLLNVTACGGGGGANSESAGTEAPESNQPDVSSQPESEPEASSLSSEAELERALDGSSASSETGPDQSLDETASGSNILVAYFSLAGEQYEVGVIEKGNTEIVAEMIADVTGADTFKIESTSGYPIPLPPSATPF